MVETKKKPTASKAKPKAKPATAAKSKTAPKKKQAGGDYASFGPIMNTGGLLDHSHDPTLIDTGSAGTFLNTPTPFSAGNNLSADSFAAFSAASIKTSVLPTLGGGASPKAGKKAAPKKKGCGCK